MIRACCPAKINLSININGKRDDGYHLIHSVMQAVSIYETVEIEREEQSGIRLEIKGADIPADKSNTAYRAADCFFKQTHIKECGLSISLTKMVPIGAGLGGGSADAAAVLVALNRLLKADLSLEELCDIGKMVGADVPFCIVGGTAVCTGTGTEISALPPMPDCFVVIAKPESSISTAEAYRLIDDANNLRRSDVIMEEAIYSGDIGLIAKNLTNDFEMVTALPDIDEIKGVMKRNSTLGCQMSGSGSAVFGLFDKAAFAQLCADQLRHRYDDVFICRPDKNGARIMDDITID
ncbi:MAG: 4-(cytidine 5'-diphospho)-2-C-methyl-D-erythritol kinase [Oscillospiraceae bacterium]|nr:4-(cytidine 5'-diphospho)-2-C-methyl-D-erythritol kinase [Oscillospiraceae bacterium]MDD4413829.1 4-(cytidine 5'-diphospho)-2-C-methyl-D-erythritol kinase [Oscillospiraceae bacterium]